jgi:hypothetical protein
MNQPLAMPKKERLVSVDVGVVPGRRQEMVPPSVCVVAIVPADAPFVADWFPQCLVRDSRERRESTYVEHVRVQGREVVDILPSLDGGSDGTQPSRLRDTVRVALTAGARTVDVVMLRGPGLSPWDLHMPEAVFALDPFLSNMVGTALLYPDLGGPWPTLPGRPTEDEERAQRFVRGVRAHAQRWSERYQIALLDDPKLAPEVLDDLIRAVANTDAAYCRWIGSEQGLRAHGWRSSAAVVAGILGSRPEDLLTGVTGFRAALPPGRYVNLGRVEALTIGDHRRQVASEESWTVDVEVDDATGTALVRSEPVMRAPVGMWSIPSMRLAKLLHWRIMQTAGQFVFDMADLGRSIALSTAVSSTLAPFVDAGVLTGPDGEGEPVVRGGVVRNPLEPGLRVEVSAVLRPWSQRVQVRVNLRPGGDPAFEAIEEVA